MSVQLIEKVRRHTGLKNYSISKILKENGYNITVQGLDFYDKDKARSMRLDVLMGLEWLCCTYKKMKREKFWELVREEFGAVKK